MKTSLPERAVIEDFTPGKGAYRILHSRKGRLLKTSLPERAVIEDFTHGNGSY